MDRVRVQFISAPNNISKLSRLKVVFSNFYLNYPNKYIKKSIKYYFLFRRSRSITLQQPELDPTITGIYGPQGIMATVLVDGCGQKVESTYGLDSTWIHYSK